MTEIDPAREEDLPGILVLQAANQIARGGALSASLSDELLRRMMRSSPLIVARRDGRVVGFLATAAKAVVGHVPVIRAMLQAHPGAADAYVYGPVCVDEAERGHGLAAAMFARLRQLRPGREGILFIRGDNPPSLAAHRSMGMDEVARFTLDGVDHLVFAYRG